MKILPPISFLNLKKLQKNIEREREREGMKKHITITWERKQTPLAAMGDSESIMGDDYDNQETIMGSCD